MWLGVAGGARARAARPAARAPRAARVLERLEDQHARPFAEGHAGPALAERPAGRFVHRAQRVEAGVGDLAQASPTPPASAKSTSPERMAGRAASRARRAGGARGREGLARGRCTPRSRATASPGRVDLLRGHEAQAAAPARPAAAPRSSARSRACRRCCCRRRRPPRRSPSRPPRPAWASGLAGREDREAIGQAQPRPARAAVELRRGPGRDLARDVGALARVVEALEGADGGAARPSGPRGGRRRPSRRR